MIAMDIEPYLEVDELPLTNKTGFMGFAPAAIFNEEGEVVDEFKNLFAGFSPVLLYFATICIVVFMLVGIPGNLFTIIALARCKKVSEPKTEPFKLILMIIIFPFFIKNYWAALFIIRDVNYYIFLKKKLLQLYLINLKLFLILKAILLQFYFSSLNAMKTLMSHLKTQSLMLSVHQRNQSHSVDDAQLVSLNRCFSYFTFVYRYDACCIGKQ